MSLRNSQADVAQRILIMYASRASTPKLRWRILLRSAPTMRDNRRLWRRLEARRATWMSRQSRHKRTCSQQRIEA